MGLYDVLGDSSIGSSFEITRILDLPVILVVNAKGASRSIAALLDGFINFDKHARIIGVILNNVSGEKHYELLNRIIIRETNLKCFGYLSRKDNFSFQSRHLDLTLPNEIIDLENKIKALSC